MCTRLGRGNRHATAPARWLPLLGALAGIFVATAADAKHQPEHVILQLRWYPQFQFAGFYAALWKGYYGAEGLDVEIRSGITPEGAVVDVTGAVAAGRAHFGIGAADIVTARDAGADLIVLASIFQTSPARLYVRTDAPMTSFEDIANLLIHRQPGDYTDTEFRAMLVAAGVDPDAMPYPSYRVDHFPENVDGYMGHIHDTPALLQSHGIETTTIAPTEYGIDFYGDSLFTSRKMIEERLATTIAFVRASLRGWQYALGNPDEIADRLAQEFPQATAGHDARQFNRSIVPRIRDLANYPVTEVGAVNPHRWQQMYATLHQLDIISGAEDGAVPVFDLENLKAMEERRLRNTLLAGIGILLILLFSVGGGSALMRRIIRQRSLALANTEQSYRALVESVKDYAIFSLDLNGRVTSWNDGAQRISGYEAGEVIGQSFRVFFTQHDIAIGQPDRELALAAVNGRHETEGWRLRRDGSRFWANTVTTALRSPEGLLTGYARIVRDMSERKEQEDRIRFQAALLNRARNAIIATDSEGCLVYMNAYAEALFLMPWRNAEGHNLSELGILPDSLSDEARRNDRVEYEVTARRSDGSTFPALCVASSSPSKSGRVEFVIHVIHDLTERKQMEKALQHSSNLALLGRMSASLVHEISQPMNVIRLTAEGALLRLRKGDVDAADMEERLHRISKQAARLFDTIDFMQTFSHREGTAALRHTGARLCACDTARSAADSMRGQFEAEHIPLELDLDHTPCSAVGNARQVEQVLVNLLTNALHAVRELRGPTARRVRLTVLPPEELREIVRIRVEDTGPGIPEDMRQQVFEPFYTTKKPGQGTGLGLFISQGIIRSMGGDLEVGQSADLGGACLEIRLPRAPESEPGILEDQRQTEPAQGPEAHGAPPLGHVLVIDDEELAREAVAEFLSTRGYQVSVASGGNEAAEILANFNGEEGDPRRGPPIDVVVTDIRMPEGSGKTLIEHISADYPQVFVIVMTGQPLHDRMELQTIAAGTDAVLRKPISLEELETTLGKVLNTTVE